MQIKLPEPIQIRIKQRPHTRIWQMHLLMPLQRCKKKHEEPSITSGHTSHRMSRAPIDTSKWAFSQQRVHRLKLGRMSFQVLLQSLA